MKSKVIKEFYGVIDGQIYPRMVLVGEIIHGDLAETALREKWATVHFEEGAKPEVVFVEKLHELSEKAKAVADGAEAVEAEAARAVADAKLAPVGVDVSTDNRPALIEIPDDWRALKWFALKSLAEKVKGAPVANADEARVAIEAELAARAAK